MLDVLLLMMLLFLMEDMLISHTHPLQYFILFTSFITVISPSGKWTSSRGQVGAVSRF